MSEAPLSWNALAEGAIEGCPPAFEQALAVLRSDDAELLALLAAAYRVRRHHFGNRVHLNYLINAKSGRCGEDCGYCAQSRSAAGTVERYDLVGAEEILAGARLACQHRAATYCIVLSGRQAGSRELDAVAGAVRQIKAAWPLKICLSAGLLTLPQARLLKAAGVDRINHNLNTSARFYPRICTTHSYRQRWETLQAVRAAGLEICSGGIVGMGEADADVADLALELGRLAVEALPVNFLIPIPGTKTEGCRPLNPRYCLKVLALFRLANPRAELRIAAGRELHLGPLQPLALFVANSLFVGGYLTTAGQPPEEDYRIIEAAGFEPAWEPVARG
jgi:biotin synthase